MKPVTIKARTAGCGAAVECEGVVVRVLRAGATGGSYSGAMAEAAATRDHLIAEHTIALLGGDACVCVFCSKVRGLASVEAA